MDFEIVTGTRLTGFGGVRTSIAAIERYAEETGLGSCTWEPRSKPGRPIGLAAAALRTLLKSVAPGLAEVLYGTLVAVQAHLRPNNSARLAIYNDFWVALSHRERRGQGCLIVHVNEMRLEESAHRKAWAWGRRASRMAETLAARKMTSVLAIGEQAAKAFTVRTGIPAMEWTPPIPECNLKRAALSIKRESHIIVTVGALHEGKNHPLLLDALRLLVPEPGMGLPVLWIVGGGPAEEDLRSQADHAGLGDRISFLGWREDVEAVIHAADVYAHPSRNETGPLAALEAAVCGLPVVAYDVGVLRSVLPKEQLFIPVDRTAKAFSLAMSKAISARKGVDANMLDAARRDWYARLSFVLEASP